MWGTLFRSFLASLPLRFIPTHVGNTYPCTAKNIQNAVHPHACGEHPIVVSGLPARSGSSPRMWGTLYLSYSKLQQSRFIPTHVGNTGKCTMLIKANSVHPHACGEHTLDANYHSLAPGSSPRMWGTPPSLEALAPPVRFIPTHVGNTDESLYPVLN